MCVTLPVWSREVRHRDDAYVLAAVAVLWAARRLQTEPGPAHGRPRLPLPGAAAAPRCHWRPRRRQRLRRARIRYPLIARTCVALGTLPICCNITLFKYLYNKCIHIGHTYTEKRNEYPKKIQLISKPSPSYLRQILIEKRVETTFLIPKMLTWLWKQF